jgi:glucose-6-phosphate 1-dehydrogenase
MAAGTSPTRLIGDTAHCAREDEVEAAWAIVDRVLNPAAPPVGYVPGSWGPQQAEGLLKGRFLTGLWLLP